MKEEEKRNIHADRLSQLRAVMRKEGMDALIIPTADYHGSEYAADCFQARAWFSGFTGSAGTLLVLTWDPESSASSSSYGGNGCGCGTDCGTGPSSLEKSSSLSDGKGIGCGTGPFSPEEESPYLLDGEGAALLWTDGRYYIQAERELDGSGVILMRSGETGVPTLQTYLRERMPVGGVLAFDGRCMTAAQGRELGEQLRSKRVTVRSDRDPAGAVWTDRPALPSHPVWILDAERYAGETAESKLSRLRERMARKGATAFVSGKLDEIMWLYNLRGNDVECNPVALSYTVVTAQTALLYLQESELTEEVRCYLGEIGVELHPYEEFLEDLGKMRFDIAVGGAEAGGCPIPNPQAVRLWYDPDSTSYAVYCALRGSLISLLDLQEEQEILVNAVLQEHFIEEMSPLTAMKAVRNETEIANFRSCYLEDSAVLTKFIYRLKKAVKEGTALTEGEAAAKLDGMRAEISDFVELSFSTISAYGPNAAMMHYEPGADGGAVLRAEGMYLVDSGAHYLRGTTDVTRTIALGPVTDEMRRDYTLTAIAQLRMMDTVFLAGCSGVALDIMAREPMWRNGMDYKCGTGHGIGYLLNVHEGPQSLRYRGRGAADGAPFEPGMIISDEPGVYKSGRKWNPNLPCADPVKGMNDTIMNAADNNAVGAKDDDTNAADTNAADTNAADTNAVDTNAVDTNAADTNAADITEGSFGIRIETILLCRDWGTTPDGHFLCFEPLTFVPLDPDLIDPGLLSPDTRASLNGYHAQVYQKLESFMDEEERAWLALQCREI